MKIDARAELIRFAHTPPFAVGARVICDARTWRGHNYRMSGTVVHPRVAYPERAATVRIGHYDAVVAWADMRVATS